MDNGDDKGRQLVFDLTVKKNACYQANGLLVSNSDGFRTVAVTWRRSKVEAREVSAHERLMSQNVVGLHMGRIRDEHFKRAKASRDDY
jgi:hypothetical protein